MPAHTGEDRCKCEDGQLHKDLTLEDCRPRRPIFTG